MKVYAPFCITLAPPGWPGGGGATVCVHYEWGAVAVGDVLVRDPAASFFVLFQGTH